LPAQQNGPILAPDISSGCQGQEAEENKDCVNSLHDCVHTLWNGVLPTVFQ
jgi:hypothetical protein